jgi:hypothetical protein
MISSMIIFAIILFTLAALTAGAVLSRAIKVAPVGFEDENGFCEGLDPVELANSYVSMNTMDACDNRVDLPARRLRKRAAKKQLVQVAAHSH